MSTPAFENAGVSTRFQEKTNDHLRNHGFIRRSPLGWELSPLYDVNPSIDHTSHLQLNIDEESSLCSIDLVLSVAEEFGLSRVQSEQILQHQRSVVSRWDSVARRLGITKAERTQPAAAFVR